MEGRERGEGGTRQMKVGANNVSSPPPLHPPALGDIKKAKGRRVMEGGGLEVRGTPGI
jgi:hypothetical protein